MESPALEIEGVIRALTQGSPEEQKATLSRYFLPNTSFSHPFCYVPSFFKGSIPFAKNIDSLWVVSAIYQWYRTLSPRIDMKFDSVAFDKSREILYVSLRQTFAIWFIPFYAAPVRLVSVLHLSQGVLSSSDRRDAASEDQNHVLLDNHDGDKPIYYIKSQEDLYPVSDCVKFVLPGFGPYLWLSWQLFSTFLCVMGSALFFPIYILLNRS
ncbi:hypothetical protein B0J13DRAFT_83231 [Dactylonectria estremocensis]|uniref:SigF-like NTF2-like domain-containing protein n=1 Tax=Dactylonectria estremocensis TaxID=1079267 RepID=A0A9P9EH32_9HYPO|nr:hypothetical protein B0J13DRAFT_83231 [Dactylonectria estremocensis]